MASTECELRVCKMWAGACVTVAAVGITDQSGATALPWYQVDGSSGCGDTSAPWAEGSVLGLPQGGIPAMGRAVPQLTVSYLWF